MKGALGRNERAANIKERDEWQLGRVEVRVKPGQGVGFPLRDGGNNPLSQLYLLLSLKRQRTRRRQQWFFVFFLQRVGFAHVDRAMCLCKSVEEEGD